jgi:hypothetical protein
MIRQVSISISMLLLAVFAFADPNDPIVGEDFERLTASYHPDVQKELIKTFPESEGYIVLRSLDFSEHLSNNMKSENPSVADATDQFRLICSSVDLQSSTNAVLSDTSGIGRNFLRISSRRQSSVSVYYFEFENNTYWLWVYTGHSMRKNIWEVQTYAHADDSRYEKGILEYSSEVERVLAECDPGDIEEELPKANLFGIPDEFDFYAPPPDYVIKGYQNYRDFMQQHAAIETDFAHDVYEIQPHDSILDWLKANAPREAYPNKEAANLQHEFKKFFERGGNLQSMNSLTTVGFDTLKAGEYLFAVGLSGRVRFGRELLREEVERIEMETGKKVPRINHAFLFPGEPVLTAGAFFIEIVDAKPKIVAADAGSGHYFYGNISPSIREDIAVRSNYYLLTLGHFFNSLDNLQIPYRGITISKF